MALVSRYDSFLLFRYLIFNLVVIFVIYLSPGDEFSALDTVWMKNLLLIVTSLDWIFMLSIILLEIDLEFTSIVIFGCASCDI